MPKKKAVSRIDLHLSSTTCHVLEDNDSVNCPLLKFDRQGASCKGIAGFPVRLHPVKTRRVRCPRMDHCGHDWELGPCSMPGGKSEGRGRGCTIQKDGGGYVKACDIKSMTLVIDRSAIYGGEG